MSAHLEFWPATAAAVAIGSAVAVRAARHIALKRALLDIPNERSSHRVPVPRLGGAAFTPVVLLALAFFWRSSALPSAVIAAVLLGALALYAISLIDDFRPLPSGVRFGVQLGAAAAVVWTTARHPGVELPLAAMVCLTVAIVGVLNIYNFMDGIDGIAGLQAIAAGAAWCAIGVTLGVPVVAGLGACLAAAALGFLTLNWPPARIFMGDAGSTVLGYLFAVAPLLLLLEAPRGLEPVAAFAAAAFALWPFLADGTFTILRRLRKRENIFKAHRSHLYQRLVIAGKSHRDVTLLYGGFAALGGGLSYAVATGVPGAPAIGGMIVALLFCGLWRWTVRCEHRAGVRR